MRDVKQWVAVAPAVFAAGSAQALTCGGPTGTRTVTVDPAQTCSATGLGNLGDGAIETAVGGTLVDRDAANANGGLLNITGVGASTGTWSLASALWDTYSSLSLYFHFGNGNPTDPTFNPDWFIVQLTSGATSGTWSVNPSQLTLSNIAIIGSGTTQRVPEPASMALLGLGIGLVGFGLKRRGKASKA